MSVYSGFYVGSTSYGTYTISFSATITSIDQWGDPSGKMAVNVNFKSNGSESAAPSYAFTDTYGFIVGDPTYKVLSGEGTWGFQGNFNTSFTAINGTGSITDSDFQWNYIDNFPLTLYGQATLPPVVSFNTGSLRVNASAGTATYTLTRGPVPMGDTGSVVYASTADGAAVSGRDYIGFSDLPIVFAAGASSASFTVTILYDSADAAAQISPDFGITLSNPINASIGFGAVDTNIVEVAGVTAATAVANNLAGKITAPVQISDSAANVAANIDGLQKIAAAGNLSNVYLTDSGTPTLTLTAAQAANDGGVLIKIAGGYHLAVHSLASDVVGHLDALQSWASGGELASITFTDPGTPTLTVTPTQLTADAVALQDITGSCILTTAATTANQTISGVAGLATTVSFSGAASQYTVTPSGDGVSFTVSTAGSTDHLSNVSALQFSDFTDIVASQTPPAAGAVTTAQITELYGAAFGRTPDIAGLAFYEAYAAAHPATPFVQFAEWFLASPEYTNNSAHNYAQSTAGDTQFINDSYNNLLHRAPESGAVPYYENNVINPMLAGLTPGTSAYAAAQTAAHAQVLVYFSQSPEFLSDVTVTAQSPSSASHWLLLI
jgi:hypothetical protein